MPPKSYSCPLDYPSGAQPNGFGAWCFNESNRCSTGPNACGTDIPCVNSPSMCATGAAGNYNNANPGSFTYFCMSSVPSSALPNGGGQLCYPTMASCSSGPNPCGAANPCVLDTARCASGSAAGSGNNYICAQGNPNGSLPNGGGRLCYDSVDNCASGPNLCDNTTCSLQYQRCSTGVAGGALVPHRYLCSLDINPATKAMGSGLYCYSTPLLCQSAANGCGTAFPCVQAPGSCSTGKAANSGFTYVCPLDFPLGSEPNGAGGLCYWSQSQCNVGPNACNSTANPNTVCSYLPNRCNTGIAGGNLVSTAALHDSRSNSSQVVGYKWVRADRYSCLLAGLEFPAFIV